MMSKNLMGENWPGKSQAFKLQSLALRVLKITETPEIASTVKFFFAVADTNRFFTE